MQQAGEGVAQRTGGARRLRALIAGGGIGGLTAARALRLQGHDAQVFERVDELRKVQVGAGLHLWPNAMNALRHVGLAEQARAMGTVMERMEVCSWRGPVLSVTPLDYLERTFGAPGIGVSRLEFHPLLAEALEDGVLQLGAEVTSFEQDEEGVTLRFADGREERGDVLIGADGITSVVRAQLLGPAPPRYAGYTIWRALIDFAHDRAPSGTFRITWGRGLRFVFYHVAGGLLYWSAIANAPEGERDPEGRTRTALLARFAGWPEPTTAIIEATPEAAIRRQDIYDRPPVRRWGEGRVTLLGDAAHPLTFNVGQGACTAIEDGVIVARCLAEERDVPSALRSYEARRMDRTANMVNRAWRLGKLGGWENPLACWLREQLMKSALNRAVLKSFHSDWSYQI
jgi:2-polyprenyl-6-methoxyphenol hydroxylase-like FAD-dependent oxidoreductase